MTSLEDRTVPTAIPTTGPNGGAWVKIDTLTVSTRSNPTAATGVASNVVLDAGTTYLAVASGTARIATDATGFTDAEYIRYNKSTGPQDGSSPGYTWNNHGIRLNGVDGGTTSGNLWGGYQADHQYVGEFVGQGTKVTGYYSDIPGYYGDNSGTLQVDLYAEVQPQTAITGRVWLDENANDNRDVDEARLDGVVVRLFQGNTLVRQTTTDLGGSYTFYGLPSGSYTIQALPTSEAKYSGSADGIYGQQVIVPAGDSTTIVDFPFVLANAPQENDWKQISGPKVGVANTAIVSGSKLVDVTLTRNPQGGNTQVTENYVLRKIVTVRQGFKTLNPNDFGTVYAAGSFNVPVTVNYGLGVEKSATTNVELAIQPGVSFSANNVLSASIGGSIAIGASNTDTSIYYMEFSATLTQDNPLMKDKDVRLLPVVAYYEITTEYELVSRNGVDMKAAMEKADPNPNSAGIQLDQRIRLGNIVAGQAGLDTKVQQYYQVHGTVAIYARTPAVPPQ